MGRSELLKLGLVGSVDVDWREDRWEVGRLIRNERDLPA